MSINLVRKFKDKQTLSKLKSRDKEAFIRVYDDNVKDIHRFVYFKIGSREEADDLTSMIFLKAWNHIQNKTLENAKTLRALLYKIARNAIVDYYRETGNKVTASLDDEENRIEIIDEAENPQERLDRAADLELIKAKLPFLKEEYREIIIMKFINDLSLEEIAEISEKSKGNIRVLLHRALNALRELVEQDAKKN
ncbi:MAG: RNA polymerase sigma factor [Patescibacteria group bacterium]|jgi:RNA polymerase sigma-70 factor (ECF subfamily)